MLELTSDQLLVILSAIETELDEYGYKGHAHCKPYLEVMQLVEDEYNARNPDHHADYISHYERLAGD